MKRFSRIMPLVLKGFYHTKVLQEMQGALVQFATTYPTSVQKYNNPEFAISGFSINFNDFVDITNEEAMQKLFKEKKISINDAFIKSLKQFINGSNGLITVGTINKQFEADLVRVGDANPYNESEKSGKLDLYQPTLSFTLLKGLSSPIGIKEMNVFYLKKDRDTTEEETLGCIAKDAQILDKWYKTTPTLVILRIKVTLRVGDMIIYSGIRQLDEKVIGENIAVLNYSTEVTPIQLFFGTDHPFKMTAETVSNPGYEEPKTSKGIKDKLL